MIVMAAFGALALVCFAGHLHYERKRTPAVRLDHANPATWRKKVRNRRNSVRRGLLILALLAIPFGLTGCDEEPPCLRGHVEDTVTVQPVLGANGTITTVVVPTTDFVCDEYAPEPAAS